MTKFEPIRKKPGELIRSEDWNKIQENIKTDLEKLEDKIHELKRYVDNMAGSVTLINLSSPIGTSYNLDENVLGEKSNYSTSVVGYITKQWIAGIEKSGEICRFGILDYFDLLYYWSGAEKGDKKTLEITIYTARDIFIHEWSELRSKGTENPYIEYLLSPNERVWYKYALENPNPDKEVRHVVFKDVNKECAPRIANVIQHIARIRPIKKP
jgi:hypothetical protein